MVAERVTHICACGYEGKGPRPERCPSCKSAYVFQRGWDGVMPMRCTRCEGILKDIPGQIAVFCPACGCNGTLENAVQVYRRRPRWTPKDVYPVSAEVIGYALYRELDGSHVMYVTTTAGSRKMDQHEKQMFSWYAWGTGFKECLAAGGFEVLKY